jgi:hypothetical protein
MKKLLLLIALFSANILLAKEDGNILFDSEKLHTIRFTGVDTTSFFNTKDYQEVNLDFDGTPLENIGFKRKGNISGYYEEHKFAIKVKTNKYTKKQKLDGIKEFTLHMNFQDPTMLREKLTYEICKEMDLYALRTAFAKVYINDTYFGLYTIVEGKDEMFKQVFNYRDMDAIESLDMGSMCYLGDNLDDYDGDKNEYSPTYTLANGNPETAWKGFVNMLDAANNTENDKYYNTVDDILNLRDFFTYQAVNVFLLNMDSYIQFNGNQIYAYDTTSQKWQVIPWDFNASFGLWDTDKYKPNDYPLFPNRIKTGCIAKKMNEVPELKEFYLETMCKLLNKVCDSTKFYARIDELKNQIQQAVYDDTRKKYTNQDFDKNTEFTNVNIEGNDAPALKKFIRERLKFIKSELEAEGYSCKTTNINEAEKSNLKVLVYPNPASDYIEILTHSNMVNARYRIINTLGQIMISGNYSKIINIKPLTKGVYTLIIESDSGVLNTQKFIVK